MGMQETGRGSLRQESSRAQEIGFGSFIKKSHRYPLLAAEQEVMLFQAREREMQTQEALGRKLNPSERRSFVRQMGADENFAQTITPYSTQEAKFETVFAESNTLDQVIANCNIGLVAMKANKFHTAHMTLEDKVNAGMEGVLRNAIPKFDYKQGYKFSTYAAWWIRKSIGEAVTKEERLIRLPHDMFDRRNAAEKADRQHEAIHGGSPASDKELIEHLTNDGKKLAVAQQSVTLYRSPELQRPVSFDVSQEGEDGEVPLAAFIVDKGQDTPEQVIAARDSKRRIHEVLRGLPDDERELILLHFGFGDQPPMPIRQVAAEVGRNREVVQEDIQRISAQLGKNPTLKELHKNDA